MSKELKPCPFCGSTDIRYSLKITGHFDVRYHASMYCNKCHCYGARTLTTVVKHDDYKGRTTIENDETIKQKAIDAWNERAEIKTGKWLPTNIPSYFGGVIYKCSECGAQDGDHSSILGRYCWRCGVKMDGGKKE